MISRDLDHVARCIFCGTITQAVWIVQELDDDGRLRIVEQVDDLPHDQGMCDRMALLYQEEWPVSLME